MRLERAVCSYDPAGRVLPCDLFTYGRGVLRAAELEEITVAGAKPQRKRYRNSHANEDADSFDRRYADSNETKKLKRMTEELQKGSRSRSASAMKGKSKQKTHHAFKSKKKHMRR